MDDESKKRLAEMLEARVRIIEGFKEDLKRREGMIPSAQALQTRSALAAETIRTIPNGPWFDAYDYLPGLVGAENEQLIRVYGPTCDQSHFTDSSSIAPSGIMIVRQLTHEAYEGSSDVAMLISTTRDKWDAIDTLDARVDIARQQLKRLYPGRIREFEEVHACCLSAMADIRKSEDAANAMRNLWDHFQGDLWKSTKIPQAKKSARWSLICDALARGGQNSPFHAALVREGDKRTDLHNSLSDGVHVRKILDRVTLEWTWGQIVDHIGAVLGLVEVPPSEG